MLDYEFVAALPRRMQQLIVHYHTQRVRTNVLHYTPEALLASTDLHKRAFAHRALRVKAEVAHNCN